MLRAALFTTGKTESTKCFEYVNWYIQAIEYYLVLKRNELSIHEKTWRKLKCILLSKRSQSEKAIYFIIPTVWHCRKRQN